MSSSRINIYKELGLSDNPNQVEILRSCRQLADALEEESEKHFPGGIDFLSLMEAWHTSDDDMRAAAKRRYTVHPETKENFFDWYQRRDSEIERTRSLLFHLKWHRLDHEKYLADPSTMDNFLSKNLAAPSTSTSTSASSVTSSSASPSPATSSSSSSLPSVSSTQQPLPQAQPSSSSASSSSSLPAASSSSSSGSGVDFIRRISSLSRHRDFESQRQMQSPTSSEVLSFNGARNDQDNASSNSPSNSVPSLFSSSSVPSLSSVLSSSSSSSSNEVDWIRKMSSILRESSKTHEDIGDDQANTSSNPPSNSAPSSSSSSSQPSNLAPSLSSSSSFFKEKKEKFKNEFYVQMGLNRRFQELFANKHDDFIEANDEGSRKKILETIYQTLSSEYKEVDPTQMDIFKRAIEALLESQLGPSHLQKPSSSL